MHAVPRTTTIVLNELQSQEITNKVENLPLLYGLMHRVHFNAILVRNEIVSPSVQEKSVGAMDWLSEEAEWYNQNKQE